MNDYLPRPDGDFNAWLQNYVDALKAWWDAAGQPLEHLEPLEEAAEQWSVHYPAAVAARQAAEAATVAKNEIRTALETQLRWTAQFVQTFPATTNSQRAVLGISLRQGVGGQGSGFGKGKEKTPFTAERGATRPLVWVESAARLTHVVRFADEAAATRRAKPRGMLGAEVWLTLVEPQVTPPSDPAALQYLTLATRPGLTTEFSASDGGKTAVYMLRWISTTGQRGPWSEIATATVAA